MKTVGSTSLPIGQLFAEGVNLQAVVDGYFECSGPSLIVVGARVFRDGASD